jgi:hypothetical protein
VHRNTLQDWQAKQEALKSFDATTGKTLLLDQTANSGSDQNNYNRQEFAGIHLIDDQVVYAKNWFANGSGSLNGKSAELNSIGADGSGHRVVKTFSQADVPAYNYGYKSLFINISAYEPKDLYVYFSHDGTDEFFEYEDGKVSTKTDMTTDKFYASQYAITYLQSPSGNNVFWAESRDGKNAHFLGDADAKSPKTIASLSEYAPYGWYSDDYLLVSKKSSELYIMNKDGGTPQKITDYFRPSLVYPGYGGGYGGV